MTEILFVLSVGLAHAMTNVDNLVVMLVLAPVIGAARCAFAYILGQIVCVFAAAVVGSAALALLGSWVGFVGFIPIGLGLFALWQQAHSGAVVNSAHPTSMGAALVLFLSLGLDTTVIMAALLGDSTGVWDGLAYLGAALSTVAVVCVFLVMARVQMSDRFIEKVSRLAPYAMILVGTYILSDSFSDAV